MLLLDSTFSSRGYGGIAEDNRNLVQRISENIEATILYDKGFSKQHQNSIVLNHSIRTINKIAFLKSSPYRAVNWDGNAYQTHITGLGSLSSKGTTFLRIHDLFPLTNPEWFTTAGRRIFYLGARAIKPSTVLLCNSMTTKIEASKNHLFSHLESIVLPCQIKPLVNKIDPCSQCWVCNNAPIHESYLLAVGTIEPRKNYKALIEAWELVRAQSSFDNLVIVGRLGWMSHDMVKLFSRQKRLMWLTPCEWGLQSLYKNASGFVSVSLAEGFDMPSMEAYSHGLNLALSDIPVHREFHSEIADFFDPKDVASIARAIRNFNPIKSTLTPHNVQSNFDLAFPGVLERLAKDSR